MPTERPSYHESASGRSARIAVVAGVALISAAVFWRTAYPTINWWDSASYSLAAATLGLTSSPGSLLLTLIGWIVTRLPWSLTTARVLSLTGAAIAVVTVSLVRLAALRVRQVAGQSSSSVSLAPQLGAGLGALAFAFSATFWEYATQFTPYILSAAFTTLILLAMLQWWQNADSPASWRQLAVLAFLFGLDFSVHRTNSLLIPSAVAWILIREPRTALRSKSWLAGAVGLAVGLCVQLLVMPIAIVTRSPLNMYEPTNWSRFWDYVSLAQVGGGFLVRVWPRNASLWSFQVMDILSAMRDNFLSASGPLGVLGLAPGLAAAVALIALWRSNRRLGIGVAAVLVLHAVTTVMYFNIPENYFRSLYRHYLPVFVTVAVISSYGMSVIVDWARGIIANRKGGTALGAATIAAGTVALAPVSQLLRNRMASDASRQHFARDYAGNALTFLPPNAILFTVGDNDSFPLWYVQTVEGLRPDVTVVNLSLANAPWYLRQVAQRDPSFPLRDPSAMRRDSGAVVIPVTVTAEQLDLAPGTVLPNAMTVKPSPRFGATMVEADWALLEIVRNNAWRRPLAVSTTAGDDGLAWLKPYARLNGLFWRIVPVTQPNADAALLRTNLRERYELRGFADATIPLEQTSKSIGAVYIFALGHLLDADRIAGPPDRCRDDLRAVFAKVPPERLGYSPSDRDDIVRRCAK